MEDILKEAQKAIIHHLITMCDSIIVINNEYIAEKKVSKNIKSISIEDRIPPKSYDLIIIFCSEDMSEKLKDKVKKYYSKFNKYLVLINPSTRFLLLQNTAYFDLHGSNVLEQLQILTRISGKNKEFTDILTKWQKYIKDNLLKLGVIEVTDNIKDADCAVIFKDSSKESLLQYFRNKTSVSIQDSYYNDILKDYAYAIDNRNIRFQRNIQFIGKQIQSLSAKTAYSAKSIQKKAVREIRNVQKNTTPIVKTYKKKTSTNNKYLNAVKTNILSQIYKFRINLYQKNIKQIKSLSYEEYLRRNKLNTGSNFKSFSRNKKQKSNPTISILMIINNIDEIWLNKSVRSVKDQTYKNWEFVIIDNCSSRTYLKSYLSSLNDPRIRTQFYNSKKTYAECLSYAYKTSKGEFISILEEGDEIEVESLSTFVEELNRNTNLEFLYSDEDQINEQGKKVYPFIKPAWDDVMITSLPYTGNLFFVKRELIDRTESFKNYNIKNPIWDMLLKIKKASKNIFHLSLILYHKRILPLHNKENLLVYNDALQNYMNRESIQGIIKEGVYKGSYYIIKKNLTPKVSIIVIDNNIENINSFIADFKSDYTNYDIHIGTYKSSIFRNREITSNNSPATYSIRGLNPHNIYIHHFNKSNYALKANLISAKTDCDYLLFIDSKVRIESPDFIQILSSATEKKSIVGARILDPEGLVQNSIYVKNFKNPLSTLYEGYMYQKQFDISVTRQCTAVSKKVMLVDKELFTQLEFDSTFSNNYHDIDLCIRVHKINSKVIFSPDLKIKTIYTYSKEEFNDSDSVKFINKWKSYLKEPDAYIDINRFSQLSNSF